LARCLAILEALRTLGIEAQYPITDRLQADATMRAASLRDRRQKSRQAPADEGKGGILALLGEGTKLNPVKSSEGQPAQTWRSPLFAKMNHAAAD